MARIWFKSYRSDARRNRRKRIAHVTQLMIECEQIRSGVMSTEAPHNTEEHGRILKFTPRVPAPKPHAFSNLSRPSRADAGSAVRDLSKFSRPAEHEPDDFSHRMKMNALALVMLVILIGSGMWIVEVMTQMRKDQDCALSGRRNCTQISIPAETR